MSVGQIGSGSVCQRGREVVGQCVSGAERQWVSVSVGQRGSGSVRQKGSRAMEKKCTRRWVNWTVMQWRSEAVEGVKQ